jgi:type IV pilus assembly protein PilB
LGDVLVEERLLAREQLNQAKRAADRLGMRLVTILLDQGLVSENALVDALRRSLRMDLFDPTNTPVELDAVRQVPYEEADRYRLLPLQLLQHGNQRVMRVAMADPLDVQAIEDIEFSTGSIVEPLIARPSELSEAIRHYYRGVVTKVISRFRGQTQSGASATSTPTPAPRKAFGGDLDEAKLRTQPVFRVQKLASPVQRVDALVALLVRKGIISQEEYEDQLSALVSPSEEEG